MSRQPRKLKKAIRNIKIIIDINALPNCMNSEKWFINLIEKGLIFYDGKRGNKPQIINKNKRIKIVNTFNK